MTSLVLDVRAFISQVSAYNFGKTITHRLQGLLSLHDHVEQEDRDELKAIKDLYATFGSKISPLPHSAKLSELSTTINDDIAHARAMIATAAPPAAAFTTWDRSLDRPSTSRMAPLNVDLPKFTGDPLGWANFESLFNSALRTRAETFGEADKRSVLSTAILHPEGQRILQDDPTAPVEEVIAQLCQYFGRAEVVVPRLLTRILDLPTITESFDSLQDSIHRIVRGHKALTAHIGNSLSEFLTNHIKAKLDPQMSRDWQQFIAKIKRPDLDNWLEFANGKICHMAPSDSPSFVTSSKSSSSSATSAQPPRPSSSLSPSPSQPSAYRPPRPRPNLKCIACSETHQLNRCATFVAFDVEKRNKLVRERRLCLNCFSDRYGCRTCPSKFSCRHCGLKHHSLLHRDREQQSSATTPAIPTTTNAAAIVDIPSTPPSPSLPPMDTAFPNTVTVSLENDHRTAKARAMFDSGAGASLMTENLANTLGLKRFPQPMSISCTSGHINSKFYVVTPLLSHCKSYKTKPINFIVVPDLITTTIPPNRDDILNSPYLKDAQLAEPDLGGAIDVFIGVSDIDDCVTGGPHKVDGLRLFQTHFGLSVSGPCSTPSAVGANAASVQSALPDDLNSNQAKLWELDQVPDAPSCSADDARAVQHFHDTVQLVNGRFSVSLPHVLNRDTRRQAYKRLLSNERSLSAKDKLDAFNTVLREYIDLGHAHLIPPDQLHCTPCFYLPVHGVFKDLSSTTKCRAVFDASAVTSSGASLNDTLLTGPNLYPPLTDVLIKFRLHRIGLSADISKMFREIALNLKTATYIDFS